MRKSLHRSFEEAKETLNKPGADPRLQASALMHMIQTGLAFMKERAQ